jgi:CubicO group peptidase (beta-lactamase class C family)
MNMIDTASVDAYILRQMKRLNIPGISMAIVEDDRFIHLRGFGRAHPGGTAPSPDTPFPIGSLTKSFTALAVMQLVEAGKIRLDAPVNSFLPWFQTGGSGLDEVTVHQLLNHTSGLSSASGWIPLADFDNRTEAAELQARALTADSFSHRPGSEFEYSNANYNLLGLIIEVASGECYADYIQNHIFQPLNMTRSFTSQAAARQHGLAAGHRFWFWHPVAEPDLPMPQGSIASGQLICSAQDLSRYMLALLNCGRNGDSQILSPDGINEMFRGTAEHTAMGYSMGSYAMGWYEGSMDQTRIIWHTGMVPDFASYMALLPEQKRGFVLLINANHFMMNPALIEIGEGVAALLAGASPDPVRLGFIPWLMRGMLLIPILQVIGVVWTLRKLHSWRRHPDRRDGELKRKHLILPLIPDLLAAAMLIPTFSRLRGFWNLFMPDFTLIARACGSLAVVWSILRTGLLLRNGLMLRSRRKPRS